MSDTPEKKATAPKKKIKAFRRVSPLPRGRHLTSAEKAHIIELYKSGTASIGDLAKRYKKSYSAISTLLQKNKARKGENAEQYQQQVQEEIQKQAMDDAAVVAARIRETKEEHYKMAAGLSKLIWKTIADAKKDGRKLDGVVAAEIKSYKNAAEALRITRNERYAILNISAQDEMDAKQDVPELIVQELTAEEIQKMSEAQRVSMDDIGDVWDGTIDDDIPDRDRIEEGDDEDDIQEDEEAPEESLDEGSDELDDGGEYTDMEDDDGSLTEDKDGD